MQENHYRHLGLMTLLSFVSMYVLMYAMVNAFSNVYNSINQVYMAGLMTAPMVIIELVVMRGMYQDKRCNGMIVPRWTAENRPLTDTAKPAIGGGRSRLVSSTSARPRCASRSALSSASCAARTSARARDAASDRGAR
jgi:hypothetical protein